MLRTIQGSGVHFAVFMVPNDFGRTLDMVPFSLPCTLYLLRVRRESALVTYYRKFHYPFLLEYLGKDQSALEDLDKQLGRLIREVPCRNRKMQDPAYWQALILLSILM